MARHLHVSDGLLVTRLFSVAFNTCDSMCLHANICMYFSTIHPGNIQNILCDSLTVYSFRPSYCSHICLHGSYINAFHQTFKTPKDPQRWMWLSGEHEWALMKWVLALGPGSAGLLNILQASLCQLGFHWQKPLMQAALQFNIYHLLLCCSFQIAPITGHREQIVNHFTLYWSILF